MPRPGVEPVDGARSTRHAHPQAQHLGMGAPALLLPRHHDLCLQRDAGEGVARARVVPPKPKDEDDGLC